MIQTDERELEQLCSKFFPVFLDYLRRHSVGAGDVELAVTLDGIYSLPAIYEVGGVQKTVRAPLALLSRNAEDAAAKCQQVIQQANTATANAQAAAAKAEKEAQNVLSAKQQALDAAAKAEVFVMNYISSEVIKDVTSILD